MTKQLLSGNSLEALDYHLMEFFAPGDQVEVVLGLDRDISDDQVASIIDNFRYSGLHVKKVQMGSTPEWPYALQIIFSRPMRRRGAPVIQLALAIKESLSNVGVHRYTGWRMR